jgi:Fuc2NAc and GlcNAc transferase
MIAAVVLFALTFVFTAGYRQLALRSGWLDHPNLRSSHTRSTPRGGGIVFGSLVLMFAVWALRDSFDLRNALLVGGAVMLAGWWDDIRGLSARIRFLIYALTSAATLFMLRNTSLSFSALPGIGYVIALLGLLWLINLYNFMDGINGIAAVETIFVLGAALLLKGSFAPASEISILLMGVCGAVVGFLLWNFPTGRVFMGDAGSALLGFVIGVLLLSSPFWNGPKSTTWLILLGVFVVDSSYTLLVRWFTGQRWHEAHRLHAYQKLSIRLGSHSQVVLLISGINVFWLLPWAWAAESGRAPQCVIVFLAYLPLLIGCAMLRGGKPV